MGTAVYETKTAKKGIVTMQIKVETNINLDAKTASPPYCPANKAQKPATGIEWPITSTDKTIWSVINIYAKINTRTGINISLINDTA